MGLMLAGGTVEGFLDDVRVWTCHSLVIGNVTGEATPHRAIHFIRDTSLCFSPLNQRRNLKLKWVVVR
jgi:hypothetical protein